MKKHAIFAILFLLLSCEGKTKILRNFNLAVWSGEFLTYEEIEKEIYPYLAELDIELFLAVKEGTFPHPSLERIRFGAWILTKEEKGYWLSTWNAEEFFEIVKDFVRKYPNVEQIILDFEPPLSFARQLTSANITEFLSVITQIRPPDEIHIRGKQKIDEMINFLRSERKKTICVFPPMVLDDIEDGDDDILRYLSLYIPSECDEYSFMVYSTILTSVASRFGFSIENPSYFVWDYAKDAVRFFGEKTAVDLGLIGADASGNSGYGSPSELISDISAALSAGVNKIHIWTVDNIKQKEEIKRWLDLSYITAQKPQDDEGIAKMRGLIKSIDRALDQFSPSYPSPNFF